MTPSQLIEKLHNGALVCGTQVISSSPRWPRALADCGLDFVFIDTEHTALGRETVSWMCQAYTSLGLPPIVRIPSPDPYISTLTLDGGAAGIIAPYIETAAQVQDLRGAVKLRPLKGQRLRELLDGSAPVEPELAAYQEAGAKERVLIINIESVPAINALDEILAVPGLDAVLIGPHDLSCSLGVPEQYAHPRFREALRIIFQKARAANVGAGIHFWDDPVVAREFIAEGANLIIYSNDLHLFTSHLRGSLESVRKDMSRG